MEGKGMKISELLEESIRVKEELRKQGSELDKIERVSKTMIKALKNGKKIILFGNGGSAADAQHIACELAGKFKLERRGLPAIALTTNTSALTAIGNDFGYDKVFSRQVEGMVDRDDVVIGISTSGNSVNVIEGIKAAKEKRAFTVGFTGASGGKLEKVVDVCLKAPSDDTPRIQEVHITVGHIICQLVEEGLFQA
jgi:D-sedoheptulose 7-phosphate isomerase